MLPLLNLVRDRCDNCYVEGHPWFKDQVGVPVPCWICQSTGYVTTEVWDDLRSQGRIGGFEGAVDEAIGAFPIKVKDAYGDSFTYPVTRDPDLAAANALHVVERQLEVLSNHQILHRNFHTEVDYEQTAIHVFWCIAAG